jgi:hypothetical protein
LSNTDHTAPRWLATDTADGLRWVRWALVLWAVLLAAVAVKTLVTPERKTVYPIFSAAARDWWAERPLWPGIGSGYRYSPTFAVLLSPIAWLPSAWGGILWSAGCVTALVAALRVARRELLPEWIGRREALFLALTMLGCIRSLWTAQSNELVLALALVAGVAAVRQRWWLASWALALAFHIKLWPVALAMLLCACWPRPLIGRYLVAVAALAAVPLATKPPGVVWQQYVWWHAHLTTRVAHERPSGYRDVWTIVEQFGIESGGRTMTAVALAAAIGVCGWCLWQRRRGTEPRTLVLYTLGAWAGWQLAVGPATERVTHLILAPLVAWGAITAWSTGRGRPLATAAYLLVVLLGTGGFERLVQPVFPWSPALQTSGVLLFLAWLAWHAATAGRAAQLALDASVPRPPRLSAAA